MNVARTTGFGNESRRAGTGFLIEVTPWSNPCHADARKYSPWRNVMATTINQESRCEKIERPAATNLMSTDLNSGTCRT